MAVIIGGIGNNVDKDSFIFADNEDNYIFGDAFSTGNPDGVREVGGFLNREGGHDVIMGGNAIDNVLGDAWVITSYGQGGSDWIHGARGDDNLFGDSFTMIGHAKGGGDLVFGGWGHDNLFGDAFEMWDCAAGSADRLYGGQGDDRLFGDSFTMKAMARGGRDQLNGGDGQDNLFGDAYEMGGRAWGQNDKLEGGAGNDNLFGDGFEAGVTYKAFDVRGGDDVLIGGTGNDALWGDFANVDGNVIGGKDVFVFGQNSGFDLIGDFECGKDLIDIRGCGMGDFSDLTLVDNGSSAVLVLLDSTGKNQILVQTLGQDPLHLSASDFLVA